VKPETLGLLLIALVVLFFLGVFHASAAPGKFFAAA